MADAGDPVLSVSRPVWLAVGVPLGWVGSGTALLSTAGTRWFRRGPGSRFGGLELADSIRSGVLSPSWGIWAAAAVYSLVGLGGGFIATAVVAHHGVVAARAILAVTCFAGFALLGFRTIPPSNWSFGPTIATLALGVAIMLSAIQLVNLVRN